jgi:hypothetical protein
MRTVRGYGEPEDVLQLEQVPVRCDVLGEFARHTAAGRFTIPIARPFGPEDCGWRSTSARADTPEGNSSCFPVQRRRAIGHRPSLLMRAALPVDGLGLARWRLGVALRGQTAERATVTHT